MEEGHRKRAVMMEYHTNNLIVDVSSDVGLDLGELREQDLRKRLIKPGI